MRHYVCLATVLTLLAAPAAAQSTIENGIRAVLAGDYQTAVRILRPLAEDAERPDPVAQFFLAILHDTGHPFDKGRACGLFLSAARRANPFSAQAAAIAELLREEFGAGASLLCVADQTWQGGSPQSFVLAPDHRVIFADTSITVRYGDKEQRTMLHLGGGAVFLPIQYTPLAVMRPCPAQRHFFQWFAWTPDETRNPTSWTLTWSLSEVVGENWIVVAGERSLVAVADPRPPSSYDVAKLVRLRVNGNGEAELTITGGSSPRTEVIAWQGSH